MEKYNIRVKKSVEKDILSYGKQTRNRLLKAISKLKQNPYLKSKNLSATDHLYRTRVGKYRIIYEIIKKDSIIMVYKIGHRKNIYKKGKNFKSGF